MRTFVHLVLFACAIVMAVGAFGPLIGPVQAGDVRLTDLRDGLPAGRSLDQIAGQSVSLQVSLAVLLLGIAAVVLLAALFGSRALGWLGVLAAIAALGVLTFRLNERFGQELRTDYRTLLDGAWGLYLFGGGALVALLCVLVPRERRAARAS
ncbi:hypothetical protein NDR87_02755 [Nocardia sp. CDC159]|uniref:Uncharacterized protein n=1 Tax=Nocardia pulmonis TaxID=2951408 RepID=A0A9X2E126_9NOCA|nr:MULTISPECIES: hypothetical protein [Nocardia]MCM6772067.1 hypothetical protein [Nocardia pulmonis]MCM6785275.1 hypothetical protein [Nocardia sp. CDC159]